MPRGKKKEATKKAWGKNEDSKLQRLFKLRNDRGGIDSEDLTQKTIKVVRETHFPDRAYKNFAPLFRSKARKWNLNNALIGARPARGKSMTLALINFLFIIFTNFLNSLFMKRKFKQER